MIETAINGQPRALGGAAHFATNSTAYRRSYFCSVSISHLIHCQLPIADCQFDLQNTPIGNQQSKIGNATYRSYPASISTGRRRNARLFPYTHRACAAYASQHTPAQASAYRCPTRSGSSDTAEYFPWSSYVPPSLRFLPAEGIRSGASSRARRQSSFPG